VFPFCFFNSQLCDVGIVGIHCYQSFHIMALVAYKFSPHINSIRKVTDATNAQSL
jgi:hypothetical protein